LFIDPDAPLLINISDEDIANIRIAANDEKITEGIFDDAIGQTFFLMQCDSFPRFLSSKFYEQYEAHIQYRDSSDRP